MRNDRLPGPPVRRAGRPGGCAQGVSVSVPVTAYSGIRSLSGILDETRVIRALRTASLAEAAADCLYTSTRGGQVTAVPVTRRTDKRVYFGSGQYVNREVLDREGYAYFGGGYLQAGQYIYASPGLAEALAGEGLPHTLPDWRDEEDKARDHRAVMRCSYRMWHDRLDQLRDWARVITDEEAAVIHARIDDAIKADGYWDDDLPAYWWRDEHGLTA
jgi:hypothetical protein